MVCGGWVGGVTVCGGVVVAGGCALESSDEPVVGGVVVEGTVDVVDGATVDAPWLGE